MLAGREADDGDSRSTVGEQGRSKGHRQGENHGPAGSGVGSLEDVVAIATVKMGVVVGGVYDGAAYWRHRHQQDLGTIYRRDAVFAGGLPGAKAPNASVLDHQTRSRHLLENVSSAGDDLRV